MHCPVRKYIRRAKRAILGREAPVVRCASFEPPLNTRVIQTLDGTTSTTHVKIHKRLASIEEWFPVTDTLSDPALL
ncbi:hypothetical protein LTR56_009167 [Elasticomyces elasticus]|nr:hypothetical protein LTR56_009167 [Elasticomyces elasticus]KAK4915601.1 hypothetical protein LTR49_016324 [Elasticomyces elasticus]